MKHFFVGVKGVIVQNGKVLLVRGDKPGRDFWDTPGGRIDDNEAIGETLERELKEELPNISAFTIGKLLYAHRITRDIEGQVSLVLLFYEVSNVEFNGEPLVSEEHTQAAWLPVEEALHDPLTAESVKVALSNLT